MIRHFKKKPVVVEAMQFTRNNWDELVAFTAGRASNFIKSTVMKDTYLCEISTLEGTMIATEYDYIIKGVRGEFYPCKPDIFWQTYDEVSDV